MLQEATDELDNIEGQDSRSFTVGLAIANQHGAVLDAEDARVGDGDFENVGSQIFESGITGGDRLAVDIPGNLPDIGWDSIQEFCLLHQIAELGFEDFGESFDGEKEIDSGGMPRAIGRTKRATANDVVNMGMVLQGASPSVEHAEEAWEIGTEVFSIEGKFFDRIRRRLEQSGVTGALVLAHERTQLFWDGKRDEEVVTRQLALDLFSQPLLGLIVLAGRTVAIAAGAKELARLSAALALVERHPAGLGTTRREGMDDVAVSLGHGASVTLEILGCEGGEDFMDGGHDRVPPSRG